MGMSDPNNPDDPRPGGEIRGGEGSGGGVPAGYQPYGGFEAPYSAPAPGPGGGPPPGALAGFWIRFAGALIDGIILSIVASLFLLFSDNATRNVIQLLLSGAYFTYLHSTKAGQTLGQRLCGIRLVDAGTGRQVEPGMAAARWLMSYVSGVAILLGFLWMLWDPMKQTWHDKVAGTLVVYSNLVPPPTDQLLDR
jgi:uncharacterized RDD family membrane protein YckC